MDLSIRHTCHLGGAGVDLADVKASTRLLPIGTVYVYCTRVLDYSTVLAAPGDLKFDCSG